MTKFEAWKIDSLSDDFSAFFLNFENIFLLSIRLKIWNKFGLFPIFFFFLQWKKESGEKKITNLITEENYIKIPFARNHFPFDLRGNEI